MTDNETPEPTTNELDEWIATLKIIREETDKAIARAEAGEIDADRDDDSEEFSEYLVRIGTALLCEQWYIAGCMSALYVAAETALGFGIKGAHMVGPDPMYDRACALAFRSAMDAVDAREKRLRRRAAKGTPCH